jgi:hypothetical protein
MFEKQEKLEKEVMKIGLTLENAPDGIYAKQYLNSAILSRQFTGVGFFTEFIIPEDMIIDKNFSGNFYATNAKFEDSDIIITFIVFVVEGKLCTLEGVVSHDYWRYDYENLKFC